MKRRLTRREKNKKIKQTTLTITFCILLCLCVGYAVFNTNLTMKAKGNIVKLIEKPVFEIKNKEANANELGYEILIHYPKECENEYTCFFEKNGKKILVKSTTAELFTCGGEIIATVSNGEKNIQESASYNSNICSPPISCKDNMCSVFQSNETIDWENSNSLLYNEENIWPQNLMDEFSNLKEKAKDYGNDEIISIIENINNYDTVHPFALYNFQNTQNLKIDLEISDLIEANNISLIYFNTNNQKIENIELDSIDFHTKTISMYLPENFDFNITNIIYLILN